MATDVANIILEKAIEMEQQEKANNEKRFIEVALDNHYKICIEMVSSTPEEHPHLFKYSHLGCKSFYIVDNDIYTTIDDDVFKPKKFINVTKNHEKIFNSLVHRYTNFTYKLDETTICMRLYISIPVYTKKNGKKWYFRFWSHIEQLDYEKDTSIAIMIKDGLDYISCIEAK